MGSNPSPFALTQVGPVIVPETDHIDLNLFIPVLTHRKGGANAFPFINPGQCFPAQVLETMPKIGCLLGAHNLPQGSSGSHLLNETEIRKYKSEPEPQQGVFKDITHVAGNRLAAGQEAFSRNITEFDELVPVIMKTPFRKPRVSGNFRVGR